MYMTTVEQKKLCVENKQPDNRIWPITARVTTSIWEYLAMALLKIVFAVSISWRGLLHESGECTLGSHGQFP